MKSNKSKTLLSLLLLVISTTATFAHALWIETKATGTKGNQHEISIFFGEFSENEITKTDQWFSDLKDFTLTVVSPSKKEIKLKSTALENKFQAFFTPEEEGLYTVIMHHTVKDLYGTMVLDYNSSASIQVGNKTTEKTASHNSNKISIFAENTATFKQNSKITATASYNSAIAKEQKIKVIAPNGWEKELWTNEKGEFSFIPIWPGNYMIEFSQTEKTSGEHNGKKYEEIWKMATYEIVVK